MDLKQLRAFQHIILTGSVSAAAKRANATQPAISRQLLALEATLGLRLFDRHNGGPLTPTHSGIEFYKSIEGTLSGLDEIPHIIREIKNHSRSRLRIAATPPIINSQLLVNTIKHFKTQTKHDVPLSLEALHRLDIEKRVVSKQIEFAIALLPIENPMLKTIPILKTQAVVVLNSDHELAGNKEIGARDLKGYSVILPKDQLLRTRLNSTLTLSNLNYDVYIESNSSLTCCRFAAEGLGIALCDPFSPTSFLENDKLLIKPWRPEVSLDYGIILRKDSEQDDIIDLFIKSLKYEVNNTNFIKSQI